jgi:hypothetical protein
MSTKINVNVSNSDLASTALEQTIASRQAFSIKSDQMQSVKKGKEKLEVLRLGAGLSPSTGRPLPVGRRNQRGNTLMPGRIDEELAANRLGGKGLLITPVGDYVNGRLKARTKKLPPSFLSNNGIFVPDEVTVIDTLWPYTGAQWKAFVANKEALLEEKPEYAESPSNFESGYVWRDGRPISGGIQTVTDQIIRDYDEFASAPIATDLFGNVAGGATISGTWQNTTGSVIQGDVLIYHMTFTAFFGGTVLYGYMEYFGQTLEIQPGDSISFSRFFPKFSDDTIVVFPTISNFDIGPGPGGALALVAPVDSSRISYGGVAASDFVEGSPFSMSQVIGPNMEADGLNARSASTFLGEPLSLPELQEPSARFGSFESYTFECIVSIPKSSAPGPRPFSGTGSAAKIDCNAFTLDLSYTPAGDFPEEFLGLFTVTETANNFGDPVSFSLPLQSGSYFHYACVKNAATGRVSAYFNGIRQLDRAILNNPADLIVRVSRRGRNFLGQDMDLDAAYAVRIMDLPITVLLGGANGASIHGFRFTPKALYSGTSFVPPTTITRLL